MTTEKAMAYLENMKWLKGYSNTTVDGETIENIIDGIVGLLEKQNPVEPTWRRGYAYCGKCGFKLHWIVDKNNYCPECGRAVKWE